MKTHAPLLVGLQAVLMAAIFAVAFLEGKWNLWAAGLWGLSFLVFLSGFVSLGKSLTMSPVPNKNGLRTGGIYRYIRHPMYLSLLIFGAGGTTMTLWTFVPVAILIVVLAAKIQLEERLLTDTYPDFEAYRSRTKRLIPFVW